MPSRDPSQPHNVGDTNNCAATAPDFAIRFTSPLRPNRTPIGPPSHQINAGRALQ